MFLRRWWSRINIYRRNAELEERYVNLEIAFQCLGEEFVEHQRQNKKLVKMALNSTATLDKKIEKLQQDVASVAATLGDMCKEVKIAKSTAIKAKRQREEQESRNEKHGTTEDCPVGTF